MIRRTVKYFILLSATVLWATILGSGFALADDTAGCLNKQQEDELAQNASTVMNNLSKLLKDYNLLAKNYDGGCGPVNNLGGGFNFSREIKAYAKSLNLTSSEDDFKYTAVNWGAEKPVSADCIKKRTEANQKYGALKIYYTKSRATLEQYIQLKRSTCTCNEKGEAVCVPTEGEEDASGKCLTFPQYALRLSSCPLCPIFEVILSADAQLATVAWHKLAAPLKNVVLAFFLALLAFESLKVVAAAAGISPGTYLKQVLVLGLKAAITILVLSDPSYIYGYFVSPVLQGGLEMGLAIVNSTGSGADCSVTSSASLVASDTLDHSLLDAILNSVRCFNTSATTLPAVGMGLMCHGWEEFALKMWFIGLLMFIFGLMIWLAVSFYLVDCTVQLGILTAMIPFLVACWPFKLTQQYSYKGVSMLMNTFFNYVMVGVLLLLGSEIVGFAASGDGNADMSAFQTALNNNDFKKLKELTDMSMLALLLVVACGIFALNLVGKINELSDNFSEGAGSDVGVNIGAMAASAGKSLAGGVAKPVARKALSPIAKLRAGKSKDEDKEEPSTVSATTRNSSDSSAASDDDNNNDDTAQGSSGSVFGHTFGGSGSSGGIAATSVITDSSDDDDDNTP